ncbi:peptide chain release factor aRF-1 [Candidatus Micrarchaeota archaeon]|jgi:peptide chain release factor subunit 1|nr:peptide chain release factor aRF-1 [Candidatus Micrarchaeota archaeon]
MDSSDEPVAITKDQKFQLKRKIDHLKDIKGSGTQLISVYVPDNYPIHEVTTKLKGELSQASNIKSKSTRTNVSDALEKVLGFLKTLNGRTPENGVAVFCGNVSDTPAKIDIQLFSIIPPAPLNIQVYRCDSKFFIEPLEKFISHTDVYGILAMDGRNATLAYLKGTQVEVLKTIHSMAHSKIHVGGQSAARFQRLITEETENYYKRIGGYMDKYFLPNQVKGVMIGGPGPAKENFIKMSPFNYQIKHIGQLINVGYTDEAGVNEIIRLSEDIISEQETIQEKKMVSRFIQEAITNGLAVYGLQPVIDAIKSHQADSVLISEDLDYKLKITEEDGEEKVKIAKPDEKNPETLILLLDFFVDLANANNIEYHFISTDTAEGAQFKSMFFGLGAFLRYK